MRVFANALACMFLLVAGCVRFPRADPNQNECLPSAGAFDPSNVQRPSGPSVVKILEYTDDGELANRCALTDALLELKAPGPEIVLIYVHGWKHNGAANDLDVLAFRVMVDRLAVQEKTRQDPRRVVGVYVAWNAKRTGIPILKELTFWGRKRAADRVSQSAAVTRLLGAVDNIRSS